MLMRSRGDALAVALLFAVLAVPLAQAETGVRVEPSAPVHSASHSSPLPLDAINARCCSARDGTCRATVDVCEPAEISVWCDPGEHARMEVHGVWICE